MLTKFLSVALVSFISLSKANNEIVVISYFDQDTKETKKEQHLHRSLQLQLNQRWKDRRGDIVIVPYTVGGFTATEAALIDSSLKGLGDNSKVVQFERKSDQPAFIRVRNGEGGCGSYIGRISAVSQDLNLERAAGCLVKGIIQHEFLHAVRVCKRH